MLIDKLSTDKTAAIYTNSEDTDLFLVGKILAVTDELTAISMVSPYGRYDGIRVLRSELIFEIEEESEYLKMLQLLYSDASSSADSNIFTSDSPYLDLLRHALKEQKIISVELLESGSYNAIGFVKEIDDDVVTIQVVDSYGREDGIVHFSVNDITELQYNSEDEQRTNAYWQLRRNGRQTQ